MAIIKQDLYVIRDTRDNKLMLGAKSQIAFDSSGAARRSLVHTKWWTDSKQGFVIEKLMPNGVAFLKKSAQLDEEYDQQRKKDWRNVDKQLMAARSDLNKELQDWLRQNRNEYNEEANKIKFVKQTRYVVESLVSVETKEI